MGLRKAATTQPIWDNTLRNVSGDTTSLEPAVQGPGDASGSFLLQASEGPLTEALRQLCDLRRMSSRPAPAPVRRSVTVRVWGR